MAAAQAIDFKELPDAEYRKIIAKPIVHACDMVPSEMANESTEIITMAVDKYATNCAARRPAPSPGGPSCGARACRLANPR